MTAEEECLLNLSPTATDTVDFSATSIIVGDTIRITIGLVRTSGGNAVSAPIRGTLELFGCTTLDGEFKLVGSQRIDGAFNGTETETFDFTDTVNAFFRAFIIK